MMNIEATLTPDQFVRLSMLHHFQRKQFYFFALTAAVVTAYAIFSGAYIMLAVVWLPFVLYVVVGIYGAYRESRDANNPVFKPTTYNFSSTGVAISSTAHNSQLGWEQFSGWSMMAQMYVLKLKSGQILAIPQAAVTSTQAPKLRALLNAHLKNK